MTKVQVLGWMVTTYSLYRHHWKSRSHTTTAIARCGQVVHEKFLDDRSWKPKCPNCLILLGEEE